MYVNPLFAGRGTEPDHPLAAFWFLSLAGVNGVEHSDLDWLTKGIDDPTTIALVMLRCTVRFQRSLISISLNQDELQLRAGRAVEFITQTARFVAGGLDHAAQNHLDRVFLTLLGNKGRNYRYCHSS